MIKRRKTFQVRNAALKPLNLKQPKLRLNCSGCKQSMEVYQYDRTGSVVIDSCLQCNFIYLDDGAIAVLERASRLRWRPFLSLAI